MVADLLDSDSDLDAPFTWDTAFNAKDHEGAGSSSRTLLSPRRALSPRRPLSSQIEMAAPHPSTASKLVANWDSESRSVNESAAAGTRRELLLVHNELSALKRQHEKACVKMREFREELKRLRPSHETACKEAAVLRRALDGVQAEKDSLEAAVGKKDDIARRLATRAALCEGESAQALRARVKQQGDEIRRLKGMLRVADEATQAKADEAKALQEALKIHADDLAQVSGGTVQASALQALAKAREQSTSLAGQLSQRTQDLKKAESLLADARLEVDDLKFIRHKQAEELLSLEKCIAACEARCEALTKEREEAHKSARKEADGHARAARALEEERLKLRQLSDAFEAHRRSAAKALESAQHESRGAFERLAGRVETERQEAVRANARAEQMEMERDNIRRTAETEQRQLHMQLQHAQERSDKAMQEAGDMREALDDQANEFANLNAQLDHFTEVNERIRHDVAEADRKAAAEAARTQNLLQQVSTLEARIDASRHERSVGQTTVKQRLELAYSQLQELMREKDNAKSLLHETQSQCASAESAVAALREETARLRHETEDASHARTTLQREHTEEVTQLRLQLEKQALYYKELEQVNHRQRDNVERLQALLESERRTALQKAKQFANAMKEEQQRWQQQQQQHEFDDAETYHNSSPYTCEQQQQQQAEQAAASTSSVNAEYSSLASAMKLPQSHIESATRNLRSKYSRKCTPSLSEIAADESIA